MWAFSENDRLVEKEIFFEMIDIMGAKECNIKRYDDEGNPTSECKPFPSILDDTQTDHLLSFFCRCSK